jgi:hypothetical protein
MQPFPSSIRSRARYLHERLASATTTLPPPGTPSENFLFWKEVFAVGGNDLLGRRLESLNLSESQALIMAQDGILTDEEPEPPKWEETLLQALDALPDNVERSDSYPFYELWLPLLGFAGQKILQLPAASHLLTPSAIDGLSISLFDDISELAASPTYLFFDAYRDSGGSFREFTSHLRASRCLPLFETFPSLARSLSQLLTTWIDTTTLFLARLEADYSVVLSIAKNQRPDSQDRPGEDRNFRSSRWR